MSITQSKERDALATYLKTVFLGHFHTQIRESLQEVDESSLGKVHLQASHQDLMVEAALLDGWSGKDGGCLHAEVKLVAHAAAERADDLRAFRDVVAVLGDIVADFDLLVIQLHHEIQLARLVIPHLGPCGPLLRPHLALLFL